MNTEQLKERLAWMEHERWSRWHRHAIGNWKPENIERWNKQASTEYEKLSEYEKEKDRAEVSLYWPLIEKALQIQGDEIASLYLQLAKKDEELCSVKLELALAKEHEEWEVAYYEKMLLSIREKQNEKGKP